MYTVYVLYSFSASRFYTGMTSDLITRFKFHNEKGIEGFTTQFRPWYCIYVEFFDDKSMALQRETELKSGKGRDWIKTNILPLYI
ncbi:GIY-YIG nuclease family protein [Cognataquiflexum rubidum]|uniref:GIY-YIG nuclease family protein n=1 Tax=Cognataquiflexum rubidum TaxID=2922273 RepID=UPI001F146F4A|nr:GIY-YIG nuclease family protein [Cognataquiflexum rubidum]MCH6236354.1 GIY-YIG nuclease family protein [Cognataquiflexum rubidum]MCH6236355.1 GIY-YIG nuclease family protein [Cognataquiflexum rubidum]